ncbi:MAG: SpoIIE family protein phosphatase [Planctomycetota bacterium]|nr:SpoIIE family protein phosphatase [Planctomycetota bacterium]
MRILIAEDNLPMRQALEYFVLDWGHEPVIAQTGEQAWELYKKENFSIVISDWMMPGMDGMELVRRIRAAQTSYVFIIILTAKRQTDDLVEILDAGADAFISKPFERNELRAKLQGGLRIIELEQSLEERNRDLEAANEQMREDLVAAAEIQKEFLPTKMPEYPGLRFGWAFRPCEQLAGDMLNVFSIDEKHVALYLLDVSGHGITSALMSVTLSRMLSPQSLQHSLLKEPSDNERGYRIVPPAEVAARLNERIMQGPSTKQFFTLIYGILNTETKELRYVSAGHPGPIHMSATFAPLKLKGGPPAIGIFESATYREHSITLKPGDRLFFYSDGLVEAENKSGLVFDENEFRCSIEETRALPLQENIDATMGMLEEWIEGSKETDDASMLGVEVVGERQ